MVPIPHITAHIIMGGITIPGILLYIIRDIPVLIIRDIMELFMYQMFIVRADITVIEVLIIPVVAPIIHTEADPIHITVVKLQTELPTLQTEVPGLQIGLF